MESNLGSTQTIESDLWIKRIITNEAKPFYQYLLLINIALSASAFLTFDMILCGPL